ncbi:MAG TPA: hypothetical protein VJZ49_07600 [Syntrophales bacterium]|nr:hypothetical protein [Syntrophales bacterium]
MKNAVLDSYAILSFLFKEQGHKKVLALFEMAIDADKKLLISAPNLQNRKKQKSIRETQSSELLKRTCRLYGYRVLGGQFPHYS